MAFLVALVPGCLCLQKKNTKHLWWRLYNSVYFMTPLKNLPSMYIFIQYIGMCVSSCTHSFIHSFCTHIHIHLYCLCVVFPFWKLFDLQKMYVILKTTLPRPLCDTALFAPHFHVDIFTGVHCTFSHFCFRGHLFFIHSPLLMWSFLMCLCVFFYQTPPKTGVSQWKEVDPLLKVCPHFNNFARFFRVFLV